MEEEEPLPDNLRCKRNDGRQWRCKRAAEIKGYCKSHCPKPRPGKIKLRGELIEEDEEKPLHWRGKKRARGSKGEKVSFSGESMAEEGKSLHWKCKKGDIGSKRVKIAFSGESMREEGKSLHWKSKKREMGRRRVKVAFSGDSVAEEGKSVPDHLRCRRSDGRSWRCRRQAMENKSFCEFHYLKSRREKVQFSDELVKKEEKLLADHLRCRKSDGRHWRCNKRAIKSRSFCERHYFKARRESIPPSGESVEGEEPLPDHLRCRRSDGRHWRCNRRVMDNKTHCKLHFLQAQHRQNKIEVPDHMKLKRSKNSQKTLAIAAAIKKVSSGQNQECSVLKRHREIGFPKALAKALKKMKLKKRDLRLELIEMVLQWEMERKKKRNSEKKNGEGELKDLPNGLMAILPDPVMETDNAVMPCERKLDFEGDCYVGRRIRSKNVEPVVMSSVQVAPYGYNAVGSRRILKRNCHQCGKSGGASLIRCLNCRKEYYCTDCLKEWYAKMPVEEVRTACPLCRGSCNCKTCFNSESKDSGCKDSARDPDKLNKILRAHYLICLLLPVVKQINQEQRIELDLEAKTIGGALIGGQVQQAQCGHDEKLYCDNCKASIVDFHRSCSKCSYDLCLSCCREIRGGTLHGAVGSVRLECPCEGKGYMHEGEPLPGMKKINCPQLKSGDSLVASADSPEWIADTSDGSIPCPPKELGGCGDSILGLRCVFPLNWIKRLEISAEEIACSYDFPEVRDVTSICPFCIGINGKEGGLIENLVEAASRDDSNDNYLYCPTVQEIQDEDLEHFQKHWVKGQPVIVRNVLNGSDLSWDPFVMFHSFLERNSSKPGNDVIEVKATDCLDWREVVISLHQFFKGYLDGRTHRNLWPEMLKLRDWPSVDFFQEQLPAHYAEFIRSLPFQEYSNPSCGLFNLATKLPKEFAKPELGPRVDISYGIAEDLGLGDSVTKLHFDLSDVANVLTHTAEVLIPPRRLSKIIKLKRQRAQDEHKSLMKTSMDRKIVDEVKKVSSVTGANMVDPDILDTTSGIERASHLSMGAAGVSSSSSVLSKSEENVSSVKQSQKWDASENDMDIEAVDSYCSSSQKSEDGGMAGIEESRGSPVGIGSRLIAKSRGVQWDVFRREDVPKLMAYLRKYSTEFRDRDCSPVEHVLHPIHDQSFFLDATHKRRLKEEFQIEPWTFEQHLGEAVMVPAGCPYQTRNVKSCMKLGLDFVSPENVGECIRLIDELRLLPHDHKAKEDKLEVKKMSLYGIEAAIKEIQGLTTIPVKLEKKL